MHLFIEYEIEKFCKTNFDSFIKIYETINHQLWHLYSLKEIAKEELRYKRFYKAFLNFNYDNLELAHKWANEYLKISPYKPHLIDGTIDVLKYLQTNYTLHIITNGFKEVQHIKLETNNLKPFFEQIIISEEHGFNKPDLNIFNLAQQLTSAASNECVMIGDNYNTDIIGALNANWKAIYLSHTNCENRNENFSQIQRLIQLKEIF